MKNRKKSQKKNKPLTLAEATLLGFVYKSIKDNEFSTGNEAERALVVFNKLLKGKK